MSVLAGGQPVVVATAQTLSLSTMFQVTASASNPSYLILNAFDRNEYTSGASSATGTLNGAGVHIGLTTSNGDARENGIVFTYQSTSGRYYNATLGYLDQATYTASSSLGDITTLSLYGAASASVANADARDAYTLMQDNRVAFLGTTTVATLPGFAGPVPQQATPNSIAAIATGFVGQAWNDNGCWTLTSTVAAEAGASLPVTSTAEIAGKANGEWFVAFNGPAGSAGNWQSMVRAGDMIGFVTGSGGGHITTCVAGSGSSAQLVDNEEIIDQQGNIINAAHDGSANDIIVQAPHAASQEWSGVNASSVVIYRLDTPSVTAAQSTLHLAGGATQNLGGLFSAADPAGKIVTAYQVCNTSQNDTILANGAVAAASAASTVASLTAVSLYGGPAGGTDLLNVRAFNGTYWGDWTSLSVSVDPAPSASVAAPAVSAAMPSSVPATVASNPVPVFRFFDVIDGTHFFTASAAERDNLIATRPDLSFEGVGMNAVSPAGDPSAESVYRFFDVAHGTHFFTASTTERDTLIATDRSLSFEGAVFSEDATQAPGDSPVYRFFDTVHGTHLYTENADERASILATRPDLAPEGIAFYAPSLS